MIKILHREYGERVRIVGVADGTGCAEDPAGLPMADLMRCVLGSLPICELNPALLSPTGKLSLANTAEGAALRNTMHNRVVADAFVPAGGRPSTINGSNWREYLQADGTASSKLIVEGANLFLTADARKALFEETGIPIIKDSSANKCGVICSSMEIVACMVTGSAEAFVALKPRYVPQVVERLRELARLEAAMLFTERNRDPTVALPSLSERISSSILRVGAALEVALNRLHDDEKSALWHIVKEQLPSSLFDGAAAGAAVSKLPWPYQRACISSGLSSRLVYREGLSFVEGLPEQTLSDFALTYLQQEPRVRLLAKQVASSGLSFASEVESLLLRGGIRAATIAVATPPQSPMKANSPIKGQKAGGAAPSPVPLSIS